MTVKELTAETSRLLELCNSYQLSLILRILRGIVRGGEGMTDTEKYPNFAKLTAVLNQQQEEARRR